MKLWSPAWANGEPLPDRFTPARPDASGTVPADDRSPPLAWRGLPAATASLVLVGHDFDEPAAPLPEAGAAAADWSELPRGDRFLWVVVDLPAGLDSLAEDAARGGLPAGARQSGYHGPAPSPADPLVHHCLFTLYALSVPRLPLPEGALPDGFAVREALSGHVLEAATLSGTFTLNPRLR